MNIIKPDRFLDCTGQICPEPVFRTSPVLREMKGGEVLELWVDDPASEMDIRSLIKRTGCLIIDFKWDQSKVIFFIKT